MKFTLALLLIWLQACAGNVEPPTLDHDCSQTWIAYSQRVTAMIAADPEHEATIYDATFTVEDDSAGELENVVLACPEEQRSVHSGGLRKVAVMLHTAVKSRGLLHNVANQMKGYNRGFIDMYGMGQLAYEEADYDGAIAWMSKALDAFPPHQATVGPMEHEAEYFNYNSVYDYLSASYAMLNDTTAAIIWGNAFETTAPKESDDKRRAVQNLDNMVGSSNSVERKDIFGGLCREDISTAFYDSTPSALGNPPQEQFWPDADCFYGHDGYGHRIGITSFSRPPGYGNISVWHGFVSDDEADHLKKIAVNDLRSSTIVDPETGIQQEDTYRTSQGAWLDHGIDPIVDRINERVARFTNKGLASMEEMHVVRYIPGQKYETHFDFSDPNREQANWSDRSQEPMGNRHMSLIIFLDHPGAGGSTVFPTQRIKVNPKKGDAVFFVNLKSNGFPDHTTQHGGCPVELGEKWIAVKWIREVRHPEGLEWGKITPSQLLTPKDNVWS